ncbi:phage tail protein [Kiloniella sp. b19]|uniref:phage tail protein n=1 Tax=Kiloniella sp. GXU_MW_B19 TaxID=3141326 RepID=UPI0031CF8773
MNKLVDLRQHLLDTMGLQPENLTVFVKEGSIGYCHDPVDRSFTIKYIGNVIIVDFSGDKKVLFWRILEWLVANETGLKPDEAFKFSADILDSTKADVELNLPLSDTVFVIKKENGTELLTKPDADIDKVRGPLSDFLEGQAFE